MNFEKKTDLIVFSLLRSNNFVDGSFKNIEKNVKVWAKKSENTIINKLLSESSKNLKGNKGYPEYLILDEKNKFVIVIENKRETKHHVKEPLQDTKYVDKYAVNGALWYGNFLAKEFDVFAIGISGNDKEDIIHQKDLKDTYVKVIVINKTDPKKFDSFIDKIQMQVPLDLKIVDIENNFEIDDEDSLDFADTKSLIGSYVDNVETTLKKDKIKSMLQSLYVSSLEV